MRTIIILFIVLFSKLMYAQQIKGVITDENQYPLEGVYVYNASSTKHAHTLVTGTFTIEGTHIGDIVEVGMLGFHKRTIVITQSHIDNGIPIQLKSKIFQLDELVITKELNALQHIAKLDLQSNPVNSSQEILRKVPGLIIGQHAGGGKAEQLFLRGFDIDHGTDINLSVDGMPVNMVSHAHGQGYSDFHFVIPETVVNVDFGKGPYNADRGDFATAGYAAFKTKDKLENSSLNLEVGQFNTLRTLGLFDLLNKNSNQNAYVAFEYIATDGPFESPQNFNRINVVTKYTTFLKGNNKLAITASHFNSRWDASGQIPKREIANGNISRFGAIDDTEGGTTSRSNLNLEYKGFIDGNTSFKSNVFYSRYGFELYSNFTFFLDDPINGDQIKQKEDRDIFGFNASVKNNFRWNTVETTVTSGIGLRHDIVDDVELSHTLNRKTTLENIQLGDINQSNVFAFVNADFELGNFTIAPALRLDYFTFLYEDQLLAEYTTQAEQKAIVSPKLNFLFNPNQNMQWFLKTGIGFHSNDTRVVVNKEGEKILPRAYGADLGFIYKPLPKLVVNSALWYLFSEQEFVYVGDAGIVEPSGKSQRFGVDLGLRYQLNKWIYADVDATYTHARSIDEIKGEDYIPLAPDFTLAGGFSLNDYKGFSGGLRYRFIDDRPANEDNSINAEGYFVTDLNLNYKIKNITIGVAVENLLNTQWNETQFATESRLFNELVSVEEIHFTPGTPFNIKTSITYNF
ncbi:TonB-dependent receptor plug domain-containing protein [Aureibaculum sp. A20]|uniref:TonB-dependent receptor plug domain-containing protein n=1 Tax=Aureibaculum flavum TaxID=2795986 RepID=A0ABS0WMW3_9FLAO|nr:TonB-dependent receptor plug domain-containing protein [Aureibaculum flavum]MBJ2173308.1 TonB-dependent receptor plug domain-containing protein [Aureibaculum flavum]